MGNQQTKAAWLAGLIDGEGCLDFQKTLNKPYKYGYRYVPRLRITMVGNEDLENIKKTIKEIELPFFVDIRWRNFKNPKWQNAWTVSVTGLKRMERWANMIIPYSITKKSQWQVVLDYIQSRKERIGKNGYSTEKGYTEYELSLIEKIKQLKKPSN